jgi:predicted alpha/beta hydrolase
MQPKKIGQDRAPSAPTRHLAASRAKVPFQTPAADGFAIGGLLWDHGGGPGANPIVVIAPATSVRCDYYARFADFLFESGFDVVTFDYRGIGRSRPPSLRGFRADWADWGESDLEAVLNYTGERPVMLVAHSIGAFLAGLAPSNTRFQRLLFVGGQYAYWRDYAPAERWKMYLKWHVAMPLATRVFGYFPGARLGWIEDTPAGVVRDWTRMTDAFEKTLRSETFIGGERVSELFLRRFRNVTAPILSIGLEDDAFGTPPALERLLAYFGASQRTHWRIAPRDLGAGSIGHFAFFHSCFRDSLWPLALDWLREAEIAPSAPGRLFSNVAPRGGPK